MSDRGGREKGTMMDVIDLNRLLPVGTAVTYYRAWGRDSLVDSLANEGFAGIGTVVGHGVAHFNNDDRGPVPVNIVESTNYDEVVVRAGWAVQEIK